MMQRFNHAVKKRDELPSLSPSDISIFYEILQKALSTQSSIRIPAEQALTQAEKRPGYCSLLYVIHH